MSSLSRLSPVNREFVNAAKREATGAWNVEPEQVERRRAQR
jgi:hypothetical protein